MCLDVCGLAANLYRRNTPVIKVPTHPPCAFAFFLRPFVYDRPQVSHLLMSVAVFPGRLSVCPVSVGILLRQVRQR